jgi:hypothetical protein
MIVLLPETHLQAATIDSIVRTLVSRPTRESDSVTKTSAAVCLFEPDKPMGMISCTNLDIAMPPRCSLRTAYKLLETGEARRALQGCVAAFNANNCNPVTNGIRRAPNP